MANTLSRRPVIFGILTVVLCTANSWGADLIPFESNWLYLHPNGSSENPSIKDTDFDTTWFRQQLQHGQPDGLERSGPGTFPTWHHHRLRSRQFPFCPRSQYRAARPGFRQSFDRLFSTRFHDDRADVRVCLGTAG